MTEAESFPLQPTVDRVILRVIERTDRFTRSGLVLPQQYTPYVKSGEVVALGPGLPVRDSAEHIPLPIQVGDRLVISVYGGAQVEVDGIEYVIIAWREVLAVDRGGVL